jgi:two-component system NtrC family response regulator
MKNMGDKRDNASVDKYLKEFSEQIKHFTEKGAASKNFEKILKETRYLYSLLEITRLINTSRDFKKLLELIIDAAITLTKAERGFLMLFGEAGDLKFEITRNIDKKKLEDEEVNISRTIINRVLATGKPLFLSDIHKDKKFTISESIVTLGLRMVMCVPIKARENLLGLIYVDSHSETESFTTLQEQIFEAFAAQTSIALENSYLYDSSVHDALTGLYNYGYLRTQLEKEIGRASRYEKNALSFIMLDLDNFKSINDSYGHIFGNTILVKVAELINDIVRGYDVAARYGGDEFAILMPDTNTQGAKSLAERLQRGIAELKFSVGKATVSLTGSIGISTFSIEKIIDTESIIVEADHALFIAKNKGGNQIVVSCLREDAKRSESKFIGESDAIVDVKNLIQKFARTDATVLIIGETGTGKELITKLIHQQSTRYDKSFVVVNCGAIPDNLLESELFGYEKGAFTGAYRQHKGKFEIANGGTIFLDEVGELPLHLQVKILRVIDQKEIDRIGGKAPIKVNIRIIAASNKDLEEEVKKGKFRKDLYYRLSVATIYVLPLRERPRDIEAVSEYYLKRMNRRYQKNFLGFTKTALEAMKCHPWPGNVRELIHRIERAVIIGSGRYLDAKDLGMVSEQIRKIKPLKDAEAENIHYALIHNNWNITHTSKALGITQKTLRRLIGKYNIKRP